MSRTLPLLALVSLPLAAGCIIVIEKDGPGPDWDTSEPMPPDSGWIACDEMAVASVIVHTVDLDGAPVRASSVTWQTADGMEEEVLADCADEGCTSWIAGYEVPGDISIEGTVDQPTEVPECRLHDTAYTTVMVPMDGDGCHVVTQEVTLVFDMTAASWDCGGDGDSTPPDEPTAEPGGC